MTWETLPTWTTKPVRSEDLDSMGDAIRELRPLFARKTSDETVNNSTTLQNDNSLLVSVVADAIYEFRLRLTVNSGTTPDFKMGWTFPTGLTMTYDLFEGETLGTATNVVQGPTIQTDVPLINTTGADQPWIAEGLVIVDSTAGTLQLQWAQNTANASDTIVRAGSYLRLLRMS